jgi:hypothetical protein
MGKIVLLITTVLLTGVLYGCGGGGSSGVANAGTSVPKPKLHLVESGGQKFLANDGGVLLYSLQPPNVTIDVDRKVFVIGSTVYYAPGTTYYSSTYDGFTVSCGGHPRAAVQALTLNFGPNAGEFDIPKSPYSNCTIQAFAIDGEGTTFKTDSYVTFFSRTN